MKNTSASVLQVAVKASLWFLYKSRSFSKNAEEKGLQQMEDHWWLQACGAMFTLNLAHCVSSNVNARD